MRRAQGLFAIGLAVLAGAAFLWLRSKVDPDVVARSAVVESVAVENARQFLEEAGFSTADLTAEARLVRKTALLRSLQRAIGRVEAVRLLSGPLGTRWPAYAWEVKWEPKREEGEDGEEVLEGGFDVSVSVSGQVVAFRNRNPAGLFGRRDSLALAAAFRAESADRPSDTPPLPALAGTDAGRLEPGAGRRTTESRVGSDPDLDRRPPARANLPPAMSPSRLVAMGRYHLGRTAGDAGDLVVDTVRADPERRGLFTVRFVAPSPAHGHRMEVDIEMTGMGMLVNLQPRQVPEHPAPERSWWQDPESMGVLSMVWYALMLILLAVVFFRRFGSRTVDTSAAARDAVALGVGGSIGLLFVLQGSVDMQTDEVWLPWLLAGISALLGGLGMAVIAFLVSGATDALGREPFRERIRTLTLVRRTHVLTYPVGLALTRGVALGLTMAVGWAVLWYAFPGIHTAATEDLSVRTVAVSPFVASFLITIWSGFLRLAGVLLGLGALLRRRGLSMPLVVAALILVLGSFDLHPVSVAPMAASLAGGWVLATAFVLAFLRYDFLTVLLGFTVFQSAWRTGLFWLDGAGALTLDGYLAAVTLVGLLLVGFVGVWGRRTGDELPEYVPEYLAEMARQERVNRELEIARHVQKTFLPREMPRVEGLDMAALCIAANEVGGDYYDFVSLPGRRLALIVGDVSGKGFQAAFYMTLAKGFFRTLCREEDSPAEALRRMNRLFWESAERGTFISLIYGILDLDRCAFVFARAGHNPVILKRSPSQVPELVRPAGLAVGLVGDQRFDDSIQECTLDVRTGDVLVFHTDGFTEAKNGKAEFYGEPRLADMVAALGAATAEDILHRITDDVLAFAGPVGQADDMTMVVLKIVQSGALGGSHTFHAPADGLT